MALTGACKSALAGTLIIIPSHIDILLVSGAIPVLETLATTTSNQPDIEKYSWLVLQQLAEVAEEEEVASDGMMRT